MHIHDNFSGTILSSFNKLFMKYCLLLTRGLSFLNMSLCIESWQVNHYYLFSSLVFMQLSIQFWFLFQLQIVMNMILKNSYLNKRGSYSLIMYVHVIVALLLKR